MKLEAASRCRKALLKIIILLMPFAKASEVPESVLSINPNVLSEAKYPYLPSYKHLEINNLSGIHAQKWINKEHTIDGWDWSLSVQVSPAAKSLVGLQRIMGLEEEFIPLKLKFQANGVGLLWVKWRDIEAVEGIYDFSKVIARIKQANEVGVDVIFRILTNSKSRGVGRKAVGNGDAPLWLEDHGVAILPRRDPDANLNFDPAPPEFHLHYMKLIDEVAKVGIPERVKTAYVGYASLSLGDNGIGPFEESEAAENDALPHVRERVDAFARAFKGMEHKVFMGGSSDYGFEKGFGMRREFVEMYYYNVPSEALGNSIDRERYLRVEENSSLIRNHAFNGEFNEEYESAWATAERKYRFGSTTLSYPYRYFTSTLRALQMRCTYIHMTGHLVPEMMPFLSLQLARTVEDAPDVCNFLRTTYMNAENYQNSDKLNRPISAVEKKVGISMLNFERLLHQRDAEGFVTRPTMKIQQSIKMWMVQSACYFDCIARAGKRIGFNIDSRWPGMMGEMAVKVTYLDDRSGSLQLVHNWGKVVNERPLAGDGKMKTTAFVMKGLHPKSMDPDFDFVIQGGDDTGEITLSMVRAVATK